MSPAPVAFFGVGRRASTDWLHAVDQQAADGARQSLGRSDHITTRRLSSRVAAASQGLRKPHGGETTSAGWQ